MKAIYSILTTLCILILTACGNSDECQSPITPKPKGAIRIMTYNVGAICKFIDANFTKENNVQLLADVINESQTDVVAIQELDSCNTRNDYFQLKSIAESCGTEWNFYYGPAIDYRGGKYGTGVMGKEKKILKTLHIPIPVKEKSEPRVLTIVEYKNYVMACTHLNGGQPSQVKYLSAEIKKLYGESKKPVFLGGDMNAYPNDTMMAEFRKDWTIISQTSSGTTVENSNKPCIDYILQLNNNAKPAQIINSAVITKSNAGDMKKASDHYAVYVDVKL